MAISRQKNNIGGIPKLSTGSLNVVSTISADSLIGHNLDTDHPVPALLDNAYGPGQTLTDPYTGHWFQSSEVIRIMRDIRFIVEFPYIESYFVAFVGMAASYTYGVHIAHYDVDIVAGCGIQSSHIHTTHAAFAGLPGYGVEFSINYSGSNNCAVASGSSSDFLPPLAFGPPILYHDFVAPGGSAGASLEWEIIKNDYQGVAPVTTPGYPTITATTVGLDGGAGIDLYHWVGNITVNGEVVASSSASYPSDTINIRQGYMPPTEVDYTEFPTNWGAVQQFLANLFPQSGPIAYDTFLLEETLPFYLFPASFIPLAEDPWLGTCSIVIYIIARPISLLGDTSLDDWVTFAKAQKFIWSGHKVIIFIDNGYLYDNGCWLCPELIPATIAIISQFCSSLEDCGFIYGGEVDYKALDPQVFLNLITQFFQQNPQSQPVGPVGP